ncbi:MAG TPA: SsrA-binding protein SmpB [Candidatus Paceibacterota bacterium]|nr:SsrA-binding protein SmpB [Candidatus Paceibacterota bacterium]
MEPIRNKRAAFDYELLATYECGVALLGTEVKSVRNHQGNLTGAYVTLSDGTLSLVGAHIPAWQEKNAPSDFDPYRTRTLLIHKKELRTITQALQTKGLTIVPISLYNKGRRIKLEVALARGKAQFNKKESIKSRDLDRESRRNEL